MGNCDSYWLSSPGAINAVSLVNVNYDGNISNNHDINYGLGVRPLVCLNSNITGTKDAQNIWKLQNSNL